MGPSGDSICLESCGCSRAQARKILCEPGTQKKPPLSSWQSPRARIACTARPQLRFARGSASLQLNEDTPPLHGLASQCSHSAPAAVRQCGRSSMGEADPPSAFVGRMAPRRPTLTCRSGRPKMAAKAACTWGSTRLRQSCGERGKLMPTKPRSASPVQRDQVSGSSRFRDGTSRSRRSHSSERLAAQASLLSTPRTTTKP
mmetsp:Transcript_92783/g.276794  ORF Transcript_92783/g.276794 Transcript_92783/m.276794 type:complete len:201 (-) Transcript_92783:395-997(-)